MTHAGGATLPTGVNEMLIRWTESPVKNPMVINYDDYHKEVMSDSFTFYWRVLENSQELEGVMVVKGSSFAAVGWRPKSLTSACKAFPLLQDSNSTDVASSDAGDTNFSDSHPFKTKLEPQPEPEPQPELEPQLEPVPQPEPENTSVKIFLKISLLKNYGIK